MREVYILGVGMTKFGKFPDIPDHILGRDACLDAIADAGIDKSEIQVAYCGSVLSGFTPGQRVLKEVGITGLPVINVENACSTGGAALNSAIFAVGSGVYDIGLAVGIENMTRPRNLEFFRSPEDWMDGFETVFNAVGGGWVQHVLSAMIARRYMENYGATIEHLAKISVKNHYNGSLNPKAFFQKTCTVDDVLNSPMLCDPLTLYHFCPVTDGAAAAIICSKEVVKRMKKQPIKIAASVILSGRYQGTVKDITTSQLTIEASKKAYSIAGCGSKDINLAEVHDAFSSFEILHYEDLGFCKKGEGWHLIEEGVTELTGEIPVNTSGGLMSRGHPLGASGLSQIAEVVYQLRGEAGKRQVKGARRGMTHNLGGAGPSGLDLDCAAVTVNILVSES